MSYWQILDAADVVIVPCVESEVAPDPAAYAGASVVTLAGPVDPYEQDLAALEAELIAQIDSGAGKFRSRFITVEPGQDMTYLRKEALARSWTPESDQSKFTVLSAEASARGITMAEQVALIIGMADQWAALGDAIEVMRMQAKLAVQGATTPEAKRAAAQVDWEALLL